MTTSHTGRSVSRRTALAILGAGGIGATLAIANGHVGAANASLDGHPLIGASYVTPPQPNPTPGPALASFTADGIFTFLDPLRGNAMGSWAATGPQLALVTLVFLTYATDDPTRFESLAVGRDLIEVDATGNAFTGQAELEFRTADGTTFDGPYGPLPFDGTRIPVEAMQTIASPDATPMA